MSEETKPEAAAAPVKRGPGRPKKLVVERESTREESRERNVTPYRMRAKANWETMDTAGESTPDRYRISPELIPEGLSAMWVTDSVFGQQLPQHRSEFERNGWTPVHQDDFEGQFDGMFMPKGKQGEINVDGLVLMVRPKEITEKAHARNWVKAREQVAIKERALRGGDLPISLDPSHPSAVRTNQINKSLERIVIPEK